jgi:hypothetical protein
MRSLLFIALILSCLQGYAQFEKYFLDKTLRLDYFHTGNDKEEVYSIDELIEEPYWGGSKINLVDTFGYGKYLFKVYAVKEDSLIYSRGYSSLFGEWQTTDEAKTTWRSFSESVVFPFPKDSVRVAFFSRNWDGVFEKKFEYVVNPSDPYIKKERRLVYPSFEALRNGDPNQKVDIVVLPEGYSQEEMGEFINDCNRFAGEFFIYAPYAENRDQFNILGILAPSAESGTDIPQESVWKSTILNSNYYTFGSERYLMSYDNKSVRDLAANAPYDQIYILVNSKKYGGGAIYNYYNVSVMNNGLSNKIITHEFGHGFAGLADEYYDSSTGYNEFYNLEIEPWEANITTLVDFEKKWSYLVAKKTPVPTPDKKKYQDRVGVFEGGGYVAKGVYRPVYDCLMKSFDGEVYCPVCSVAIQQMIDFYSE